MRVRLKIRMAGPQGNHAPGEIIEVSSTVAGFLITTGSAEPVGKSPIETTTAEPDVEMAIKPKPKRRKKGMRRSGCFT